MTFGTILAGSDDTIYGVVLFLHILAVIAGFGPTFVYPVFAAMARNRPGAEGLAINEVTLDIAKKLEYAIYAVPILGIILVLLSDDVFAFSDPWVVASLVLYLLGLAVSTRLHLPNLARMNELQRQLVGGGSAEAGGELEERGKRAGMYGGILHLTLAVILWLMIFKPGWP